MNTTTTTRLIIIDATTAKLEDNIRADIDLDDAFLATVREYGILTPVLGRIDADGQVWIRTGQRRHAAAQLLAVQLPVFVYESNDPTAEEPAWVRTAQQLIENDNRKELNQADRVKAWQQMTFDGLSLTELATTVNRSKVEVKAAMKVAKSAPTLALAAQWDVDLISLATMTEFSDDAETMDELARYALENPDQFEHAVARARNRRADKIARAAKTTELEAEGKTVISSDLLRNGEAHYLHALQRDPSIAVSTELGDGIVYVVQSATHTSKAVIDPAKFGYKISTGNGGSNSSTGPRTEAQKTAMRRVIACNKAWDAAESVRIQWLTEFFTRKSFPKDAGAFVAIALTRFGYDINNNSADLSHTLAGIAPTTRSAKNSLADLVENNPTKAGLVTLALIAGKLEAGTSRRTWRDEQKHSRFYLRQLRSWGYTLSPVELIAIGEAENLPDDQNVGDDADLASYSESETDSQ